MNGVSREGNTVQSIKATWEEDRAAQLSSAFLMGFPVMLMVLVPTLRSRGIKRNILVARD